MKKMTLKEFLYAYADNMVELMENGNHTLNAMMVNCSGCPFRDLCHNDNEESGLPCEQFILNQLTDGANYKAN